MKNIKCLNCKHSWKTKSKYKVVNCPSCRKPVLNPQYKIEQNEE